MTRFQVHIQDNPQMLGKSLYIIEVDGTGQPVAIANPIELTFRPLKKGEPAEPTIRFDWNMGDDLLYALKDALTDASLGHSQGELKAMKSHLADMRLIALRKLGIKEDA